MLEIIDTIDQQDPEWFTLRLGSIGGSSIGKVAAKSKDMKQRTGLLYDFVGEIISGVKKESYQNKFMADGTENEAEARDYYSLMQGVDVRQVALIRDQPHKHVSPDGLIGDDGMLEIKCIIPNVFIEHCVTGSIPTGYRKQIQWGLKRSGRQWCDYAVYCKLFVGKCDPMSITRIYRNEIEITSLEVDADRFILEMLELVNEIKGRSS